MVLQDVKEHIDRYEFSEAINKLKELIVELDDKIEPFEVLLKVLKENSSTEFNVIETDYLLYLSEKKLHEKMYNYCSGKPTAVIELSMGLKLFKLEALWEVGKLKEFLTFAKELNTEILDRKYFHSYDEFYEIVNKRTSKQAFLRLGKIIYLLEIGDVESYKEVILPLKEELTSTKKNCTKEEVKVLASLNNILFMYKDLSPIILYDSLFIKYLASLYAEKRIEVSGKELIEFIALNNNRKELYILLEMELELLTKDGVFEYLKRTGSNFVREIPFIYKNTKKMFKPDISMARVDANISLKNDDVESPEKYEATKVLTSKHIDELFIHNRMEISKLEKDLITQFEIEPPSEIDLKNLIISFIEMNMNHIALNLTSKMEPSTNKSYLLAQVNFNICDYSDAIYYVNHAINEFSINLEESVPFLYIKARSFEALGKQKEAQQTYRKIASTNPGFMDTRSKLNL